MPYDYTLRGNPYLLTNAEQNVLEDNPVNNGGDWSKDTFDSLKSNLKIDHLRKQRDRCGYCRIYVEPDGYYDPIEHIIPKAEYPKWMFEPTNLIVTCNPCNNLKGATNTLSEDYEEETFPGSSENFLIFNPHFDRWSEHFELEDDVFIRPIPNSKGSKTIEVCKLHRYHIMINHAREQRLENIQTAKKLSHKIHNTSKDSPNYQALEHALNFVLDRID